MKAHKSMIHKKQRTPGCRKGRGRILAEACKHSDTSAITRGRGAKQSSLHKRTSAQRLLPSAAESPRGGRERLLAPGFQVNAVNMWKYSVERSPFKNSLSSPTPHLHTPTTSLSLSPPPLHPIPSLPLSPPPPLPPPSPPPADVSRGLLSGIFSLLLFFLSFFCLLLSRVMLI